MAKDIHLRGLTSYLVFLCLNTVWRNTSIWKELRRGKNISILDVGCGGHSILSKIIKHYRFVTTGLDIFEPSVREAKNNGVYQHVVVGDAGRLPFKDKEFDLVTGIEVIEHAEKEGGEKMLAEFERVARWRVLITTPIGKCAHRAYGENLFEEHKYIWSLEQLRAKGYTIRGKGIKGITQGDKWWLSFAMFMRPLQYAIYVVGTLFSYLVPAIAGGVIAWKSLDSVKGGEHGRRGTSSYSETSQGNSGKLYS